jgi:hypothetical protein
MSGVEIELFFDEGYDRDEAFNKDVHGVSSFFLDTVYLYR